MAHIRRNRTSVCARAAVAACALLALPPATAMQALDDSALATVHGGDGLSFDLSGFSLSGDARFTYYTPAPDTASAYVANLYAARSDDTGAGFSDPYRLDITPGSAGLADIASLAFPQNASGLARWQVAYDWGVNANGGQFDGGSVVVKDTAFYGGGIQWSTPVGVDGIAFGLALRMDIGNLLLRPRGRGDISVADTGTAAEQMNLSGIHLGAVDSSGNFTNTPWRIADVAAQPGVINAVSDDAGNARLHLAIGWPDAGGAATGGLLIDNIAFHSDVTGNLDLGSSRVGSMQIQYLDIKVRP